MMGGGGRGAAPNGGLSTESSLRQKNHNLLSMSLESDSPRRQDQMELSQNMTLGEQSGWTRPRFNSFSGQNVGLEGGGYHSNKYGGRQGLGLDTHGGNPSSTVTSTHRQDTMQMGRDRDRGLGGRNQPSRADTTTHNTSFSGGGEMSGYDSSKYGQSRAGLG